MYLCGNSKLGEGELEGEGAADVFFALDVDFAVVGFDEAFNDGQAETGADCQMAVTL